MTFELLKTKLYAPPLRPYLVSRPRLLERLNEGLRLSRRLSLVSAPAGFGKSTLVSEWLVSSQRAFAWLTLDSGDNDPVRFWRYVIAALQTIDSSLGESLPALLQSAQPPPLLALVTRLINELIGVPLPHLIVLDDYHRIENEAIHESVRFFLENLPPHAHLVVATRADPPLQLSHFRGRAELTEIRAADLRFTSAEAAEFLNQAMRLGLSSADLGALEERTEGWIAGLQMAALAMQAAPVQGDAAGSHHAFVAAFSGDDRFVADYLVEEVLQRLPGDIQDFLLYTSIADQLNAPLCDVLTKRSDSQAVLNDLERANLFIVPLDNRREWFRYHHLFSSLLRQHLLQKKGDEFVRQLRGRASRWFEQNGMLPAAIEYALAGRDFETAVRLIESIAQHMFWISELTTLLKWGEALPERLVASRPKLCLAFAWAAIATGHPEQCEAYIQRLERSLQMSVQTFVDDPQAILSLPVLDQSAIIDAAVARTRLLLDRFDILSTKRIASQVLPYLVQSRDALGYVYNPPSALRPPMIFMIGLTHKLNGELAAASQYLQEAAELGKSMLNIHIVALASGQLGETQVLQGQLRQAAATFEGALKHASEHPAQPSAFFGIAHGGLGNLAYEWNDLDRVLPHLNESLEQGKMWKSWECLLPCCLGLARFYAAQGDWERAEAALENLQDLPLENLPAIRATLEIRRAYLHICSGEARIAGPWPDLALLQPVKPVPLFYEENVLLLARIFHAQGNKSRAHELLTSLLQDAERAGRQGRVIEMLVFQAAILEEQGGRDQALAALQRALHLAEPQGYVRTFLDGGGAIRALLSQLARRLAQDSPHLEIYCRRLLQEMDSSRAAQLSAAPGAAPPALLLPGGLPAVAAPLAEALSQREIEVLELVATGAANAEIAGQLFISVNTVKKHISKIFAKLGATTRLQAVELGRKYHLIK